MQEIDFVFVILLYKNMEDIKECLDSILNLKISKKIILVNNFYDEITKEKAEKIAEDYECEILFSENNGYGCGNNIGIKYANEHFLYKFLVVSNPDIVINKFETNSWINIENCVLGPIIHTLSGKNQNPYWSRKNILFEKILYVGMKKNISMLRYLAFAYFKLMREIAIHNINKNIRCYALHGAFVIFHRGVIEKLGKVYDESIFMYSEEIDIANRLKKMDILSFVTPTIEITHKEDGSVKLSNLNLNQIMKDSYIKYYEKENVEMKISVVICTYNGEKFIGEQLKSIINQTRKVDEIIISDDNSSDCTVDIINKIIGDCTIPCRIIQNNPAKGVADNFLCAMKQAIGDYIFTSDQDDVWKSDKVEVFMKQIEKSHNLLYFSDGELVDENMMLLGCSLWSTLNINYDLLLKSDLSRLLLNRCVVTGSAMAVSKELIGRVTEIPQGWLHDGWCAILASILGTIEPVDCSTYYYRQHSNNVVGAHALTFVGRFKSWLKNIRMQRQLRENRYNRYVAVGKYIASDKYPYLDDCIIFWSDLMKINGNNKIKSILIILKNILNRNYTKYYTGIRGGIRDILTIFC